MTTTDTAATQAYKLQTGVLELQLFELTEMLKTHREAQAAKPDDWGFVGDLTHWNELLDRITLANVETDPFAGIVDVEVNDGWDA